MFTFTLFCWLRLVVGAGLLWDKITVGWLMADTDLVWEKNTIDWSEKQPSNNLNYCPSTCKSKQQRASTIKGFCRHVFKEKGKRAMCLVRSKYCLTIHQLSSLNGDINFNVTDWNLQLHNHKAGSCFISETGTGCCTLWSCGVVVDMAASCSCTWW